jgi:enoyl-CoA hydratase/carnithine racemase
MADTPVVLEQHGVIAELLLNAPPRNEMNRQFFDAWAELVRELPRLAVAGLIVRGRGRHFSSGADVEELRQRLGPAGSSAETCATAPGFLRDATAGFQALAQLPFPVVAAISGACLGSGLELALACHYRVATPTAVLGLPETSFQLMPGCGGTVRLPAVVGVGRAIELVLTGRRLLAPEAREMGLIDGVVERDELRSAAAGLIRRLCSSID